MTLKWERIDGFSNHWWRLVDSATGRIVGQAEGTTYKGSDHWRAHICGRTFRFIGLFVTEDLAKKAVELEIKSKESSAHPSEPFSSYRRKIDVVLLLEVLLVCSLGFLIGWAVAPWILIPLVARH